MAEVLNLNNEVVKMRKDMKRVRALLIRRLTRQIASLKKKKGTESEVQKNQRRVTRLQEEISEMKALKPDYVTKRALQKNLNFEKICKDAKSTLADRATARIATHPLISKKIADIKTAIRAFKDERKRPSEAQKSRASGKPDRNGVKTNDAMKSGEERHGGVAVRSQKMSSEPSDSVSDVEEAASPNPENLISLEGRKAETESEREVESLADQEGSEGVLSSSILGMPDKNSEGGGKEAAEKQPASDSVLRSLERKKKSVSAEESDFEASEEDEEGQYFDDSTEERFHKKSSQSEDSDDDDFFLGKVCKLHKKKSDLGVGEVKKKPKVTALPTGEPEMETKEKGGATRDSQASKTLKLQSAFCSSLSGSAGTSTRGASGKSKAPKFQKAMAVAGGNSKSSRSQNCKQGSDEKLPSRFIGNNDADRRGSRQPWSRGPNTGKERPKFEKQMQGRGWSAKTPHPSQNAQQTLHPSWEASKRRKEQQAQITAFQGKKIKFDD